MQGRGKERKTSNISPEGSEKHSFPRLFASWAKKRVRDEREGREEGASFSAKTTSPVPVLDTTFTRRGWSIRERKRVAVWTRGGRKSRNGGSKARNDSRLWRVGSGSEDISSSPFHPVVDPDRRRVRWPSVGRRGKNGWTETAVSSPTPPTWQDRRPCLLPNYERERIRRASSPSRKRERRAEMPWDDAGREGGGAR